MFTRPYVAVGCGVAMGNAGAAVRGAADHVVWLGAHIDGASDWTPVRPS